MKNVQAAVLEILNQVAIGEGYNVMSEGKVKWYDKKKGYGFIAEENGGDIFVHYTSFSDPSLRTLTEGQLVTFEIVQGEKGPRAQNLSTQNSLNLPEG